MKFTRHRGEPVGHVLNCPIEQEGDLAQRPRAALPRLQQGAIEQGGRDLRGLSHAAGYADHAGNGNHSRGPDAEGQDPRQRLERIAAER